MVSILLKTISDEPNDWAPVLPAPIVSESVNLDIPFAASPEEVWKEMIIVPPSGFVPRTPSVSVLTNFCLRFFSKYLGTRYAQVVFQETRNC